MYRTQWLPNGKLISLRFFRLALQVSQVISSAQKNSVNFVGTLRFRSENKSFGQKQKEVIRARLGTSLHLLSIDHEIVARRYKLHRTGGKN